MIKRLLKRLYAAWTRVNTIKPEPWDYDKWLTRMWRDCGDGYCLDDNLKARRDAIAAMNMH